MEKPLQLVQPAPLNLELVRRDYMTTGALEGVPLARARPFRGRRILQLYYPAVPFHASPQPSFGQASELIDGCDEGERSTGFWPTRGGVFVKMSGCENGAADPRRVGQALHATKLDLFHGRAKAGMQPVGEGQLRVGR